MIGPVPKVNPWREVSPPARREASPSGVGIVRPPVDSSGETNPLTRLPREPRTRTIFTSRRITPLFGSPSHRTVDPRWRRSPTEPRAVAVRGAQKI
ncbi:hypothetical protein YC2023_101208 [Brassica napus]